MPTLNDTLKEAEPGNAINSAPHLAARRCVIVAAISAISLIQAALSGCHQPIQKVARPPFRERVSLGEPTKITASDATRIDQLGWAVSLSGNVAVLGAHYDDEHGDKAGSAYVYRFDGTSWGQEKKLIPSDVSPQDQFGNSVSVAENVIVVGSFADIRGVRNAGAVYVFRFDGADWVETSKLTPSDPVRGRTFGYSVCLCGTRLLIGAPGGNGFGRATGAAYVFEFNGSEWIETAKLIAPDAAMGEQAGISVALAGDLAVVGAWCADDGGRESGAAFIYQFNGSAWVCESRLTAPDAAAHDHFGSSVATDGSVVVVGAPGADLVGTDSGAACAYARDGTTWRLLGKLEADEATRFDRFGEAVAVMDGIVVIGASRADDGRSTPCGAIYLFEYDGSHWSQRAKVNSPDAKLRDNFGYSLAISRSLVLVGSPWSDDAQNMATGSAYIFHLNRERLQISSVEAGAHPGELRAAPLGHQSAQSAWGQSAFSR